MLTIHVTSSVGWLGAIVAYVALNVPALGDADQSARAAYLMMAPVMRYALVPLALVSLATGIAQALGTPWGLFRHYWVTISLAVTLFATAILVLHIPAVESMRDVAADPSRSVDHLGGDLFHSIGGFVVLLVPLILNIYKPKGMTPYGWRRRQALSTAK